MVETGAVDDAMDAVSPPTGDEVRDESVMIACSAINHLGARNCGQSEMPIENGGAD